MNRKYGSRCKLMHRCMEEIFRGDEE